jgi:glycosyltransferase involved in cell wall biosynthesis
VLLLLPYEPAAFMQADMAILQRRFDLAVVVHNQGKRRLFFGMARRLLRRRPNMLVMWFVVPSYALVMTVLAKLFRVKVVFITGGFDVVSIPRIDWGAMRVPLFRLLLQPTLALADLTLPFSLDAAHRILKYARPRRSRVVYPGIDTNFFAPSPALERQALAVTVSPITASSITQKGLKTFVEAARYAPEVRFVLVGRSPDGAVATLREIAPANVEFIDRFLPAEELRDLYSQAWCYVQASVHEGFGIAVAEAMACGAAPVVTRRFSLPEVTGGLGMYIPLDDPQATAVAVRRMREVTPLERQAFRNRIVRNYTLARRETELTHLLRELCAASATA